MFGSKTEPAKVSVEIDVSSELPELRRASDHQKQAQQWQDVNVVESQLEMGSDSPSGTSYPSYSFFRFSILSYVMSCLFSFLMVVWLDHLADYFHIQPGPNATASWGGFTQGGP